ncbi:MAG: aldo/keto reductase, partial [Christensenellaceae bacterium]|nr:aldo/keto reductase [Christensenellaceae bacterium]
MKKFERCNAFETVFKLMDQGKIKHFGISFHDSAEILDQILRKYPQIEVVQIQLNYLDYDDNTVQGKKCLDICRKYNKPVIVMEPVRGGRLTELPTEAKQIFDSLGGSPASYAIRYAASFGNVMMVLSGMSNLDQMQENIGFMKDFKPLDQSELDAVYKVRDIIRSHNLISCTTCRYCVSGCPKNIPIPDLFTCYNNHMMHGDWIPAHYYKVHSRGGKSASACISCGMCEKVCPQHLKIRELLKLVSNHFEK